MKQRILSCNLPEAIHATADGMVSMRSQIGARHGLDIFAEDHPMGPEVVVYFKGERRGSWPLSEAWNRTWGEVVDELAPKKPKAVRGSAPDDAKP